jgi:hypothetical protein
MDNRRICTKVIGSVVTFDAAWQVTFDVLDVAQAANMAFVMSNISVAQCSLSDQQSQVNDLRMREIMRCKNRTRSGTILCATDCDTDADGTCPHF